MDTRTQTVDQTGQFSTTACQHHVRHRWVSAFEVEGLQGLAQVGCQFVYKRGDPLFYPWHSAVGVYFLLFSLRPCATLAGCYRLR